MWTFTPPGPSGIGHSHRGLVANDLPLGGADKQPGVGGSLYVTPLPRSEGPDSPSTACKSRCSWKQL